MAKSVSIAAYPVALMAMLNFELIVLTLVSLKIIPRFLPI